MSDERDFRVKPGRIRSARPKRVRSLVSRVLAATEKAGGRHRSTRHGSTGTSFGRGGSASLAAQRRLLGRHRSAVVKARVVRHATKPGALRTHIAYLKRDSTTRDGSNGLMFDAAGDDVDVGAFAERCQDDRHHFRFIVSPDDAAELADLKAFTRDLMDQASRDLGTNLDWIAIDHWDTEHPHIHVLVRGRDDKGKDLVIARDYISHGMRARASDLVSLELGPRTDREIQSELDRQVDQERWTKLDRVIAGEVVGTDGIVDLRLFPGERRDALAAAKLGRLRTLQRLGLATPSGPARWQLADDTEQRLRSLGERNDIIKRMHKELAEKGWQRGAESFALSGETEPDPIIGRLVARGIDDELKGTAFAIVDGIDGRAHHIRFADLDAASDAKQGAIVELRRLEDRRGRERVALAVCSDLPIEDQVSSKGATWLDRRLIERDPMPLSGSGFGGEVQSALTRRAEHLTAQGHAREQNGRTIFARNLLATLKQQEMDAAALQISAKSGLPYRPLADGEPIAGTYSRRFDLASGRFAMIDDGLGFQLVPWKPSLERELGRQVSGVMMPNGGVDWSFGRKRGLSI
jgi:type IV secretory pathway VirD2 relaxase